ncbi:MAG: VWA domain-containing protein [bacterium]|nr:VWA domain-containing protein [bacterium]
MRKPPSAATLWLSIFLILLLVPSGLAAKKKAKPEDQLPEKYREWLVSVEFIISKEERVLFLAIEKDYQRDAFIERFWKARDTYPRTGRNEFREDYEARLDIARREFETLEDDRARILLLNGTPLQRLEIHCSPELWPTEVWHYDGSDLTGAEFLLLFYQRGKQGRFTLWQPIDGTEALYAMMSAGRDRGNILSFCGEKGKPIMVAIQFLLQTQGGWMGATIFLDRLQTPPKAPQQEWIATFSTYSTDLPESAETFDARLEVDFPGRHQSRTVLQGTVLVPVDGIDTAQLGEYRSYNLMLNGEILREGKLFENFRYKYDFQQGEVHGEALPLVFQRYLRPDVYTLVVKIEDVNSGRLYRDQRELTVPKVGEVPPPKPEDPETARILAEANAAISSGENTIKLVALRGEWQIGLVRINTMITGDDIHKVTFLLDDQPILTKKNPPYDVELHLGQVPQARILRVEAFDEAGEEIASDETMLNSGKHRFAVRLVEPRRGKTYTTSLRAQADVVLPEGEVTERVEFYLNETLVATIYQPPYIQPIILPTGEPIAYVRAVAYTPDGNFTEDLVFVNAPDYLEEIDVDFVELYTTVLDRDKRPVGDLTRDDFKVLEDETAQELMRFEQVRNLPIYAAVMLDISASMVEELSDTQAAALGFFEQAVTPKDRATVITFNDHPNLVTKFTNDVRTLSGGLAGLKAERGTALYDSLIFALYYFNGIKGQRAILLLSDGKDETSRFEFDDALEYARRAGVAIYAIGLKLPRSQLEVRRKLSRIAGETGGRSFFPEQTGELPAIYDAIQNELRSRYLLAYQSSNTSGDKGFRTIKVEVARSGLEAKTLRGYYP